MKEYNKCVDGKCPAGIEAIRKIGLTPKEKRAIFHSIVLNLKKEEGKEVEETSTPTSEVLA
jgi:hypothetical protein